MAEHVMGGPTLSQMSSRLRSAATGHSGARRARIGRQQAIVLAGMLALATSPAAIAETTTTKPMAWEDCLAAKAEMQLKLAVEPDRVIDIVTSAALNVTRLCTSEGAVSISCSKADQTLIISVRPQQSELSCLWRSLVNTPT
jgi:hypothetical protein